jgi:hypothetical protein
MPIPASHPRMGTLDMLHLDENATDALRNLIHLTRHRDAFDDPAELCTLVADLAALTGMLPQLLDQLCHWLHHQQRTQYLRADDDSDPDELVAVTAAHLTQAGRHARHLAAQLDTAHQHVAHLATG